MIFIIIALFLLENKIEIEDLFILYVNDEDIEIKDKFIDQFVVIYYLCKQNSTVA